MSVCLVVSFSSVFVHFPYFVEKCFSLPRSSEFVKINASLSLLVPPFLACISVGNQGPAIKFSDFHFLSLSSTDLFFFVVYYDFLLIVAIFL